MKVGYVALIGRPNVGKSTLLNRLLGEKVAIVSDKPQTTRISILGIKTTASGQIIFIDNPGIHKPLHILNKRMMQFVHSALESADLLCLLIDATQRYGHGDEFVIETLRRVKTPILLLINKVDAVRKDNLLPLIDKYKDLLDFKEIIPISARTGINLDVLEKTIVKFLPEAEKVFDDETITNQTLRFMLAEIIREKLLQRVEEELPFVTAVLVERLEERKKETGSEAGDEAEVEGAEPDRRIMRKRKERKKTAYLQATIFVEKDNQRKIVIGRNGQVIKEIGIEARREIEDILEARVFLDLKVKVKPRWRDSAAVLDLIEGQR